MKLDNIDIDSELFKQIKDFMINDGNEDKLFELESNVTKFIDLLKKCEEELSSYDNSNYQERISVI